MAKRFNNYQKQSLNEPRINDEIRNQTHVRLIYKEENGKESENDFNKIVTMKEAMELSKKYGLDLIEINSKTNPIIVRLEEYSKYMYNLKKQAKKQNKNKTVMKEIQISVSISENDLNVKINKAKEFLHNGYKVKLVLTIKGRENARREESKKSFYTFISNILDSGIGSCECQPTDEDRKCYVIFKKK